MRVTKPALRAESNDHSEINMRRESLEIDPKHTALAGTKWVSKGGGTYWDE